jgi:hypothetical protein
MYPFVDLAKNIYTFFSYSYKWPTIPNSLLDTKDGKHNLDMRLP